MSAVGKESQANAFGSLAAFYEKFMVPMVFDPFADAMVEDVGAHFLGDVLETAAGTGIVTRKLAALGRKTAAKIVATDSSLPMVELGKQLAQGPDVTWQQADAMNLPFPDASFDTVICQFGVMFLPERVKAFQEALRVLRPSGQFIFSVWDKIQENAFVDTVQTAVASLFPNDPPHFLPNTPHGYFDLTQIADDLHAAGFRQAPAFETITRQGHSESASVAATAYTQGTPLRAEIEARAPGRLEEVTTVAVCALAAHFGPRAIEGQLQAIFVTVGRPL
jgi:ubiquinone/menaquinone biosynthesis C-methylase UbiE